MNTIDELVNYCHEPEPAGALLLTGEWGCGKTHIIEHDLKRELYKIQKINHKQYNKLYESVGKAYADFYIFAIYCLTPVEHNEEFEELYRELSNNEQ